MLDEERIDTTSARVYLVEADCKLSLCRLKVHEYVCRQSTPHGRCTHRMCTRLDLNPATTNPRP